MTCFRFAPTDEEHLLHRELFRVALGKRFEMASELLPAENASIREWVRFNKDCEQTVPSEQAALNVCTCLDKLAKDEEFRWVNMVYGVLSEYCHPNAASRSLECQVLKENSGTFYISYSARHDTTQAFLVIYDILNDVMMQLCNRMQNSLRAMSSSRMGMHPVEFSGGSKSPQIGYVPEADEHGRRVYYRPTVEMAKEDTITELTVDQLARARTVFSVFEEFFAPASESDWIACFGTVPAPMVELRIKSYEQMMKIYLLEISERPPLSREFRSLLFRAVFFSGAYTSPGDLLSSFPMLKRLPGWERVYSRIMNERDWVRAV